MVGYMNDTYSFNINTFGENGKVIYSPSLTLSNINIRV